MKVSCLGPEGSYSQLAAETLCPQAEQVLCAHFPAVLAALTGGEVDYAVIPIENSIQGGVLQNLDLLDREPVFAVAQTVLPIDHRLALKKGTRLEEIDRVYSHEQAIGQCSEYLLRYLPHALCVFTNSTAESLSRVDERSAGIVGAHARAEGVVLSEENIANEKHNYTQFFLLSRRENGLPEGGRTVFLSAVLEHRPGALFDFLQIFASRGVNLTRIESRPIRGVYGEYRFFIELEGAYRSARVQEALEAAQRSCRSMKLLGAY